MSSSGPILSRVGFSSYKVVAFPVIWLSARPDDGNQEVISRRADLHYYFRVDDTSGLCRARTALLGVALHKAIRSQVYLISVKWFGWSRGSR